MTQPERVYFLADMHLKPLDAPSARAREMAVTENERLAAFLEAIDGTATSLVLLGDTFNFWFERRSRIVGDYGAALALFKLAADNGLAIHHVSGNRDYAVGEGIGYDPATRYPGFLRLKRGFTVSRLVDFGIEPHGARYRFHHAGKTVSCVHGDGFCTEDRLFMLLRWTLLGPLGRAAMRRSPWPLVSWVISGQQARTTIHGAGGRTGGSFAAGAVEREFSLGADLVLCGHIHAHYERDVEVAGRQGRLDAVPAWLDGGYAVLEDGELRVERFKF